MCFFTSVAGILSSVCISCLMLVAVETPQSMKKTSRLSGLMFQHNLTGSVKSELGSYFACMQKIKEKLFSVEEYAIRMVNVAPEGDVRGKSIVW